MRNRSGYGLSSFPYYSHLVYLNYFLWVMYSPFLSRAKLSVSKLQMQRRTNSSYWDFLPNIWTSHQNQHVGVFLSNSSENIHIADVLCSGSAFRAAITPILAYYQPHTSWNRKSTRGVKMDTCLLWGVQTPTLTQCSWSLCFCSTMGWLWCNSPEKESNCSSGWLCVYVTSPRRSGVSSRFCSYLFPWNVPN